MKENCLWLQYNSIETNKEKVFKATRESGKRHITFKGATNNMTDYDILEEMVKTNNSSSETNQTVKLPSKSRHQANNTSNPANLEFHSQKKFPSKWRWNKDVFREKLKEFCQSWTCITTNTKKRYFRQKENNPRWKCRKEWGHHEG